MEFVKANFHTHTPRCHHAVGEEREYIEAAIKLGFSTLGFSDHAPYFFDEGYISPVRMLPKEAEGYVNTLKTLREEYKDKIDIKIGFEMEYYPKYFGKTLEFLKNLDIDYLILAQHYTDNEYDGIRASLSSNGKAEFEKYIEQVCRGIETGVFSYVAHPDCINLGKDLRKRNPEEYSETLKEGLRKICKAAKNQNIPLEINLLGQAEGMIYPSDELFCVLAQENMPCILGCDAHSPKGLNRARAEKAVLKKAKKYGIYLMNGTELNLKKIGKR